MENRSQYLYTIKPTRLGMLTDGGTHEEGAVLGEHYGHLRKLTREGTVILAGRTQTTGPETFGIVIFYAEDDEEAEAFMAADPAVAQGVMQAELFPYRIALMAQPEGI